MKFWFYADLQEPAGWYSTAVRAATAADARRLLQRRFPAATILTLRKD